MRRFAARACAYSGARRVGDSRIDLRRRHAGLGDCALQRLPHKSLGVCPLVGGRLAALCRWQLRRCILCIHNRCRSLTRSACSSSCSGTATSFRRLLRKLPFTAETSKCAPQPSDGSFVAQPLFRLLPLCSVVRGLLQEGRSGARISTRRTRRCALRNRFTLETLRAMRAARRIAAGCVLRAARCCLCMRNGTCCVASCGTARVAWRGVTCVCVSHATCCTI